MNQSTDLRSNSGIELVREELVEVMLVREVPMLGIELV